MGTWIVEDIFPAGRIHLLAGISNAGKSRWLLPALYDWAKGMPLLGKTSYPTPWCVISSDRPLADIEDTIGQLGLPRNEVNIIPAFGSRQRSDSATLTDAVKAAKGGLIFWEGFDMVVRNPNDPYEVRGWLSHISAYCEEGDITVIGSVGIAKLKPREAYENPRQLVAGSTIWERATSSNLMLVPYQPGDLTHPGRKLYVSLKNSPSFQCFGRFNYDGRLVFDPGAISYDDIENIDGGIRDAKRN
jgi:hypothetical protein